MKDHRDVPDETGWAGARHPWLRRLRVREDGATLAGQPVGRRVVLGVPSLEAAPVRRLAELGLRAGVEVVVLHRTAGRGRVLAVGDTRIALDRATLRALPVASTLTGTGA